MLRKFLSALSRPRPSQAPVAALPAGERVYAIGDIHGRLDLLEQLFAQIDADDAARGTANTTLIFLGDLIDRGPDSAQVVQWLMELGAANPGVRFLLGNHEEVFLKAMAGDAKALAFFVKIGGKPTVLSYGISEGEYLASDYPELLGLLRERVPPAHVEFLSNFEDMIVMGDYAFVHAGISPDVPLDQQQASSLRWIRNEFLDSSGPFDKVIVHGHTIFDEVEERSFRIGLDTGAYASGKLTAMGFECDERWILQTTET